jgi:hypothetical protein
MDWNFLDALDPWSLAGLPEPAVDNIDFKDGERSSTFRGTSTGIEILCSLRRFCNTFAGFSNDSDQSGTDIGDALDTSLPETSHLAGPWHNMHYLSHAQVYRWVTIAFAEAFMLWPFIDRQTFDGRVSRLFEQGISGPDRLGDDELSLIHAVIGLGQRHDPSASSNPSTIESMNDKDLRG